MPSGEMVAPVIQCILGDQPGWFPLNIPNAGQVADLADGVVVESMCVVDGNGARGRDVVSLPGPMADALRRFVGSVAPMPVATSAPSVAPPAGPTQAGG